MTSISKHTSDKKTLRYITVANNWISFVLTPLSGLHEDLLQLFNNCAMTSRCGSPLNESALKNNLRH